MFRALILFGIIAVAAFVAVDKILAYASGAKIEPVRFDRIMVYIALMVATCTGLAVVHHWNLRRTGGNSRLLKTERSAATIDGALSAGAGIAFLVFDFMRGTSLEVLAPIADSLVILLLCLIVRPQPLGLFRGAFDEVLGAGLPPR
ncbi:Cation efflux family protein [Pseudoruegeria aquimaris]|uniref:Cation efflux family protein n=1 Tax=Pseudoruegeria aquimaris TaxID=393663 RepID=A0A1Y5TDH7_9RHOB|nr:cation transporter [Pseudoruegeria aquimaris]SLN61108.1 Cation efflux family protein [Pseudoruegeria aquimaris]